MAGILILAEHFRGALRDITAELAGAALSLKDKLGGPVTLAVLSDGDADLAASANLAGVDEVLSVNIGAADFDAALYEEAAFRLGERLRPQVILLGHTVSVMAYAPALAARLGSGFASDVFGLDFAGGELIATRSAYGGKVNLEVAFPGKAVVVLTLRGAVFAPAKHSGSAKVESLHLDLTALDGRSVHLEYQESPTADIDLSKAEFILSVGRGMQDKENLPRFSALADKLGAAFGCSRPIIDAGWLPRQHQVGQSGKVATNCKLYLALGISGAIQHQFGMKHVDTIIAVNSDPNAPIFNVATYGAVVDLFAFADALERQLE